MPIRSKKQRKYKETVMKTKRAGVTSMIITTVTLCLTLLGGTGAFVQEAKPCAGDIERFCQGVQPGGGRIAQCLKQHKEQISPSCKLLIAQLADQVKEVHEACEDDIMSFCQDVEPGGGRIANCLAVNQAQLSPECKAKISEERN